MSQPDTMPTDAPDATAVPLVGEEPSAGKTIVLAWVISLGLHVILFILMFVAPWLTLIATQAEDLPIARTELAGESIESRLEVTSNPDLTNLMKRPPAESLELKPKEFDTLNDLTMAARSDLSIVGIGTGGEDFSRYGLGTSDGGTGPSFFGIGGKARGAKKIVYVVDRSGSMLATFDAVRRELIRSTEGLRRSQRFHVIFFNAGDPLENPPKKLVPATGMNKKALADFLGTIQAEGSTDPIPAMRRAFDVKPDLVYFLTDGDFDPALLDWLRKWNRNEQVRIFTLAYVSQAGRILLEQISREHNGEFKFISEHDIY
jgi:hypothetical protein